MLEDLPELIGLKEAAKVLSVHPATLRRWEKQGKISAVRLGSRGDRRFTKQNILNFYHASSQN